jgi:hypothetical protein
VVLLDALQKQPCHCEQSITSLLQIAIVFISFSFLIAFARVSRASFLDVEQEQCEGPSLVCF